MYLERYLRMWDIYFAAPWFLSNVKVLLGAVGVTRGIVIQSVSGVCPLHLQGLPSFHLFVTSRPCSWKTWSFISPQPVP